MNARRVGRPRSPDADEAILRAVLDVFAESGYEGLSVETVAERAGVAKTTIYRRYPNKGELVLAALHHTESPEPPAPHTESLEEDLFRLARRLRDKFGTPGVGSLIPTLVDASLRHPEFAAAHRRFLDERRRHGTDRIRVAIREGELDERVDPDVLLDLVVATVFYRTFVTGAPLDDTILREVVRLAVAGAGA
ncbi:MAG: TetR/AcrR family transcriptional regulator [Microthrixaceae bacterium]